MLASDDDRERVVRTLQEQVGSGRLTLTEFSERAALAYRARTLGDLAPLIRDLPAAGSVPTTGPSAAVLPVAVIAGVALIAALGLVALIWMSVAMQHMGPMMGR
ncbi:DUF1707 domain-containing protein [Nocardia nova]|uniref:DUF1707 domain-containing protein n=1 Tax=Nocardia nova TaxID=37330 RepID=UPI00379126A7